jgi:Flp pilus assembly protein TadD
MEFPMIRSLILATALLAGATAGAQAQSCDAEPQFAAHRTANGSIRAQYNAVTRSEWRQAIHFGEEVAASGAAPSQRTAALSNLCYAYAATGEFVLAVEACDAAAELTPTAWRAINNRGAAHWLAGERAAAIVDFNAAATLAGSEDEVEANLSLAQCA